MTINAFEPAHSYEFFAWQHPSGKCLSAVALPPYKGDTWGLELREPCEHLFYAQFETKTEAQAWLRRAKKGTIEVDNLINFEESAGKKTCQLETKVTSEFKLVRVRRDTTGGCYFDPAGYLPTAKVTATVEAA